jgi:hypothetical protein
VEVREDPGDEGVISIRDRHQEMTGEEVAELAHHLRVRCLEVEGQVLGRLALLESVVVGLRFCYTLAGMGEEAVKVCRGGHWVFRVKVDSRL